MNSYPDLNRNATPLAATPLANHLSAGHLSADQLDDHLIGDLAAAPAAHLAVCSLCSSRVAAAAAPIVSFQRVANAWSERHSATLPVPLASARRPLWHRNLGWATACLSVAIGIALTNTGQGWLALGTPEPPNPTLQTAQQQATTQQASADQAAEPPTIAPAQVSADNHMLQAIDTALDTSTETPAALGLQTESGDRTPPPTTLQD